MVHRFSLGTLEEMFKWETSILCTLKDEGADLSNSKIASKVADSNVLPPHPTYEP